MDLTAISLEDFLCVKNCIEKPADINAFANIEGSLTGMVGQLHRRLSPDYALHRFSNQMGDFLILYLGTPVGIYCGETLAVAPAHMGKKLSVPLVLAAVSERPLPSKRMMSPGGKKALEYAWLVARGLVPNPWP